MREPWRDGRKRLEDALDGRKLPRIGVVPVSDDAPHLYKTWIAVGGEGIVLKKRGSSYRPGIRTPAWLKLKPKVTLKVVVTGGSGERLAWATGARRPCSTYATYIRGPAPTWRSVRPSDYRGRCHSRSGPTHPPR
jgi:hypothetical protein